MVTKTLVQFELGKSVFSSVGLVSIRPHETKYHSRIFPQIPSHFFLYPMGHSLQSFRRKENYTSLHRRNKYKDTTHSAFGGEKYMYLLIDLCKCSYGALETRRELRPKRIPQLFLGSYWRRHCQLLANFFPLSL